MPQEILKSIIEDFSLDKFDSFFRDKSKFYKGISEDLSKYNQEFFSESKRLGFIDFGGKSKDVVIIGVKVDKELTERVSKKAQYDFAKKLLKEEDKYEAGIFIFYDQNGHFRFSLIYPQYQGRRRIWNNFRRFTYFVNKEFTNKTFKQRIGSGNFLSLKEIKDAFSVEKVTNKFFEEFREYFEKTKEEFEKSNKNTVCLWLKDKYTDEEYKEQINKFTYTFLGRIIFIYFLQRKGWIENKTNYLRKFVEDKNNISLYINFFQPLFFNVLCKKEDERSLVIKKQYKDTPYLNGGLFEKSELENQLEKSGKFIIFEDNFIREIILNFFEIYNFTINENLPDDQEVSIDPEMLGKVFENTLAEEERGKKGTFYTPREIVHFMVKESLCQFLKNETNIDQLKLHNLVYKKKSIENLKLNKEDIRLIDKKLENIKILDPAVGSAAFPVEMMQVLVDIRKQLNVNIGKNINEVLLKKIFIKDNLYGVDIDPGAIEIAKLRLWLALIVDYEKSEAELLPNLDFKFRLGNSLQEKIDDIDIFNNVSEGDLFSGMSKFEKIKGEMIVVKDKFYISDNEDEKRKLKKEFDNLEHKLIQAVLDKYEDQFRSHINNVDTLIKGHKNNKKQKEINKTLKKIASLKQKIKDGTYKLFKPDFHFSEVFDRKNKQGNKIGGFDIVIGNPPYGVKVEDDIKEWHGLGSKDSYGVFISTALKRFLKPGGVLFYIVSDTWLTIKTHKPLREQVLAKQLHKIVRVHQDCFEATVNACIMSLNNSSDNNGKLITADLTNISTRKEIEEMRSKLYYLTDFIGQSTPKFAVYEYNQDLIKTNSNIPIFVGSPKLFALINDTTCQTQEKEIKEKKIKVRQIKFNSKIIELVRFGDIADVRVGLQTGDNKTYLFQNPQARGRHKSIVEYKKYLLTNRDLEKIAKNDELRLKVIKKGFHKSISNNNFDEDLWFDGRYIIPYDKGGESDVDTGFLPNYYVPTDYFIDWSNEAVEKLSTVKTARFQNKEFYFREGLTLSYTGQYAPNLRINSLGVFDVGGSSVFSIMDNYQILGNFVCKITKYIGKNWIDHSVNFQVDENKELPILFTENKQIKKLVKDIVEKQKQNPRYDYISNEQKEIDKLVYEMYGLNKDDIKEVETWYARRYPKLAKFCDID